VLNEHDNASRRNKDRASHLAFMKLESISAFFPAYNDEATIGDLVEKTYGLLASSGRDFEVLVVDDGSRDGTAQVLERLSQQYGERFRIVRHPVNRGYGAALRSGIAAARKDLVFYTDGDGQYDPGELATLLDHLRPGVGLVNGYKVRRSDPFHRILIGKAYNAMARCIFGISLRDIDCDFRLIRRSWLENAQLQYDSGVICVEMIYKLERMGCRVVEVPVSHYPRTAGRSQFFRWRSILKTLGQLTSLYFSRWAPPIAASEAAELNSK
jgi:glycosyltransferase involved in cell wall biosynthesis